MQTFTFTTHLSEETEPASLKMVFGGTLTLQNAGRIKQLLEQQAVASSCRIEAHDVAGLDVSFLQIIEAYKNRLKKEGKNVSVSIDLPYDLKTLLANAGIEYSAR